MIVGAIYSARINAQFRNENNNYITIPLFIVLQRRSVTSIAVISFSFRV